MSTGTHRKTEAVKLPRIPWMHATVVVFLVMALFGGILLAQALADPVQAATASYLRPAVTAVENTGLKPSVKAYTQFLAESGSYGLGVNPAALPWY